MKAEDLMIGDWVQYQYTGSIFQIVEISKTEGIKQFEDQPFFKLNGIIPIPLTPEILEKNGLSNDPYGCYFKEDEYMALEISVEREGIYWTINYNEYGILRLKYVHQLQHALKLCGIDKEIVI